MIVSYIDAWVDHVEKYTSHHSDPRRFTHLRLIHLDSQIGDCPGVFVCGRDDPATIPQSSLSALSVNAAAPDLARSPIDAVDLIVDGWVMGFANAEALDGGKICAVKCVFDKRQESTWLIAVLSNPESTIGLDARYRAPSLKLIAHKFTRVPDAPRAWFSAVNGWVR